MSKTVDQRVVDMQFDNKQFEENVQTSMSTIEKLKESLKFKGATKGLEDIDSASKRINMAGLGTAVETVQAKFSAMQVIAVTALANITNSAVNAGKRIASALTIDPIKTGLSEYETQINAVQTILANTESKGSTLADVNKALDELNTYADKTIYNFTEMTRNIGTFTAAGVDLNTSVNAIKGIANLAAVSGSNSQQASTAMYQLSQALSSGTVKLMDWNSVVNAGMGGQVFQDAIKETARAHGIEIDKMIEKEGSFRETLSSGWLTADVLLETLDKFTMGTEGLTDAQIEANRQMLKGKGYTDEQIEAIFKLGNTATNAATKVKTATQLWDTLKETAQSGWTQTWEIIFGDFEEAKVLFSDLYNTFSPMIEASSAVRNEMLVGWKELGGRTAVIDTLYNAINGVVSIVKPIKGAFSDIFPPITSEQLFKIVEGLKTLSARLILSDDSADKLKRTFKGVFSIFDIGIQIVKALVKTIIPFFDSFKGAGGSILDTSASIGDFLVNLKDTLKESDYFVKKLSKVAEVIRILGATIVNIFSTIGESYREPLTGMAGVFNIVFGTMMNLVHGFFDILETLTGKDLSKFESAVLRTIRRVANVVIDFVDSVFAGEIRDKIYGFAQTVKKTFDEFKNVDTSGLDSLGEKIKVRFEPFSALGEGILKVFGLLGKLVQKVAPLFGALMKKIGEGLGWLADKATDVVENASFDSLSDVINVILTGGLVVGLRKMFKSFSDMAESAGGFLGGITDVLEGVKGTLQAYQDSLKADTLMKIASAIGILAVSLIALALVDSDKLSVALSAVTALFLELFGAMSVFTKTLGTKGLVKLNQVSAGLIGISTAVLILSFAMLTMSSLDWDGILKGVTGVAGLCLTLAVTAKTLSSSKGQLIKGATGLITFSLAILILAEAVEKLSLLNKEELTKGLIGVGALCAELALFLKVADFDGKGLLKSTGMIALATAIIILAEAVEKFGVLDSDTIIKGLASVGVVFAELALFTKLTGNASKVMSTATAMTILGAAMLIFGEAIENMGSLSLEQIGKGLLAMAVSLTAMVAAMNLAKGAMGGAVAITMLSTALLALVPAIKLLGGMDVPSLGKGLLALVAVFAVFGAAGYLLQPVTPTILALSAAITMLGIAVAGVGVGFAAFSAGLYVLAKTGPALMQGVGTALASLLKVFANLVPLVGNVFREVVLTFLSVLVECIPTIVKGVVTVISEVLEAIVMFIPNIVSALGKFVTSILKGLRTIIPEIAKFITDILPAVVEAAITVLMGLLKVVREVGPTFIKTIVELLATLLKTIAEHIPDLVQSGMDILLGLLKGIADNIGKIVDKAVDIVVAFISGVASKIPDIIQSGVDLMLNFINGLANGIRDNTDAMIAAVDNLISAIVEAIGKWLIHFTKKGGEIVSKIIDGVSEAIGNAIESAKDIVKSMAKAIGEKVSAFTDAGKDLVAGFIKGIKDKIVDAANAAREMASNAWNAVCDFLGINSPATKGIDAGMYFDKGMAVGLTKFAGCVSDSATDVGKTAINSLSKTLSDVSDMVANEIDAQPTIRPVLDLSSVESGANKLNTMFSRTQALKVSSGMNQVAATDSNAINPTGGNHISFTQNNYSPKSLSRLEIYRQTKNQFSAFKEVFGT